MAKIKINGKGFGCTSATNNLVKFSPSAVWDRAGLPYSRPAEALISDIRTKQLNTKKWLSGWQEAKDRYNTHRVFALLQSNAPGQLNDIVFFAPFRPKDASSCLAISAEQIKMMDQFLSKPKLIAFPATLIVWHDSEPGGDYVTDLLLLQYASR